MLSIKGVHRVCVRHCDAESSNGRVGLASLIAAASICPDEQFLNRLKEGEEYPGPLFAFPSRFPPTWIKLARRGLSCMFKENVPSMPFSDKRESWRLLVQNNT